MANKKFSEFTLKTDPANVDFVVGYDGTDNVRIDPSNLAPAAPVTSVNSLTGAVSLGLTELDDVGSDGTNGQVLTTNGSGSFTFQDAGGGGASDLNGLSDCLVDTASLYVGEVPSGLSGNPQGNTVLGVSAGDSLTTGNSNTFIGNYAGLSTTTNDSNVAIGFEAARANQSDGHTSIGHQAGYSNTSGNRNVNIGYQAGYKNTTEGSRTVIGYEAGEFNTGASNTFIGSWAGQGVTNPNGATGASNTCIGSGAGRTLTTGNQNTILGTGVSGPQTGYNNTLIGVAANVNGSSRYNVTCLGAFATGSGSNDEITLGNSSVAALRCAVTSITSLSDERDKSEIKDLEYGLDFIDALQPREFVWDNRPETRKEFDKEGNETEVEFYSANKGKKDFGFIAQEVRELDNDTLRLVYDVNEDRLEMSYGKLVPILVKAVQELKAEIELLKG